MDNQDKQQSEKTPTRMHHICLPFDSETQYDACVNDCGKYREFLTQRFHQYPELFPRGFDAGFHFHARYRLKKLNLFLRRIKVNSTGKVFTIRPSFIMPYGTGRTDEVWKPLLLHAEGASLETLVEVFGHDLHYWERMWLSLGRPSLVGTTVKDPEKIPANLVADEKITWQDGEEVLITTIASEGCFLGAAMARGESAAELETAYGEFKAEVRKLAENYTPESVCTDGFRSTRLAWLNLFPKAVLILCFLHGILKIRERCRGELREETLTRAWHCYHARTRREFSQRLRRLDEWAEQNLTGSALEMVKKLSFNRGRYTIAYEMPAAYRTTSAVDRLMNHQDRMLYATCYLHGSDEKARLNVRAKALQWNFHTYSQRVRREDPARISPFADLNGFVYHENWLHNLLIAASLGGHPT